MHIMHSVSTTYTMAVDNILRGRHFLRKAKPEASLAAAALLILYHTRRRSRRTRHSPRRHPRTQARGFKPHTQKIPMTNWLQRHRPDPDKLDTGTAASPAAAETITSTLKKAGRPAAQRRIQDEGRIREVPAQNNEVQGC